MADVPISSLPPMVTPLGGGEQFVGNQFGTTGITTTADISSYIGQSLMPLIYGGSANKLPIQTSAGTLIDSGINIFDGVATNQNLWTALKTSTAITTALAAYIPAVSGAETGNLPQFNGGGILVDSGKSVNDTITTAANLWSALQTQTAITTGLLNTPSLPAAQFASTANVATKSGLTAIDGYTPVAGDKLLLKNQTDNDNGVWAVAAGAWTRQKVVSGAWANVATETTYSQLGIQGGVINVLNGTLGKNLQYQISIANPAATFGNTTVTVTATTKLPALNPQNIYADSTAGNDTNFNGTQSFPFATLSKAFTSISTTPVTINLMGNSAYSSAITWTQTNTTVQGNNLTNNGGQQTVSGQQTFASGSRYNHFTNTYHSTGSTAPFAFASGALCSNEFKNISVVSTAADWLGLNAGCRNWVRLNNITFGTPGINAINLPAFTNAFTIYVDKQDTFCGPLIFTGTGAANTIIVVGPGIAEGNVRVPTGFLGTILNQQPFTSRLGSFQRSVGVITNQTDLTTVLSHTASIGYDGYYAISGFNPTSFSRGAIIGKQTLAGVGTSVFYVRQFAYAPGSVQDLANTLYTPSATGSDWPVFSAGTSTIPTYTMASRPANNDTIGFNSSAGVVEELNTTFGPVPLSTPLMQGVLTGSNLPTSVGLWLNNSGSAIGPISHANVGYWDGAAYTNCYAFGNLPATITAGGTVYQKYQSGWTAFGATVAQYAKYSCPNQTVQPLSANYPVKFTRQDLKIGTTITVNAAGDQITLAAGYTYRLRGSHGLGDGVASVVSSKWYDALAGVFVGNGSIVASPTTTFSLSYNPAIAEYTFTAAATTVLQLRIDYYNLATAIGYSVSQGTDQQPWFEVEAIAAPAIVPTSANIAPVAFAATLDPAYQPTISPGQSAVLTCGVVEHDTTGGYSGFTGKFTCPVAGIYNFSWSATTSQGSSATGEILCYLEKNGVSFAWANNQTVPTTHYNGFNGSAMGLKLAVGDEVRVVMYSNGETFVINPTAGTPPTRFAGHLVR